MSRSARRAYPWLTLLCSGWLAAAPPPSTGETKSLFGRDVTEREFEMQKVMYRQLSESGAADPLTRRVTWTEVPRYTYQPLPVTLDESALQASLDCCRTFAIADFFEKVLIKANLAGLPNFASAQLKATWNLTDATGKSVKVLKEENPQLDVAKGELTTLLQVDGTAELPEDLEGWSGSAQVELKVPIAFTAVSFSAADLGKTQSDIKLVQLHDGDITLEGPAQRLAAEGDAQIFAFSKEGLPISYQSASRTDQAREQALKKLLDTPWRLLPKVIALPEPGNGVVKLHYGSPVDHLQIYLPEKSVTETLDVKLVPERKDGTAVSPLFDVGHPRKLCALTPEQAKAQVKVFATRSSALAQFGQPTLVAQLPPCDESAFGKYEMVGLSYAGATGSPLKNVEVEEGGYSHDSYAAQIRFTAKPAGKNPHPPDPAFPQLAKAKGKLKVEYPRLHVVTLSRAAPKAEGLSLELQPNKVTVVIPQDKAEKLAQGGFLPPGLKAISAWDDKGRLLRDLGGGYAAEDDRAVVTQDVSGSPDKVDVILVQSVAKWEVPFSVAFPSPPKPEKLRK